MKKKDKRSLQLELAGKKLKSYFAGCMQLFTGTPPPVLYHYTSESSLIGIIQSGRFWASNLQNQNDVAGVRYAAAVLRAHVERFRAHDYRNNACELFAAMRPHLELTGDSKLYTISLVTDGDCENLWRLYGDRGAGCSLAFPTASILDWADDWYLLRVCYSDDELNNFCRYSLSLIRAIYLEDKEVNAEARAEDYASLFFRFVSWFGPMFKARVWSDENEWRLVRIADHLERKERTKGRYYVEAPAQEAGKLELGAVCLGPNNQSQEGVQRVRVALSAADYGSINVHLSSVPRILSV
jgi:hypothetical protein